MDFISFIRDQSMKLNSREYVNHLWDELEENNNTETEINLHAVTDFNTHLPLILEQFWEDALEKLNANNNTLDEIDDNLKIYLLVLLYHQCTIQNIDSFKSVIYASQVYLQLLVTPQSDDFYRSKLYRSVLRTLQTSLEIESATSNSNADLIRTLRVFLHKSKLNVKDLEMTLATLLQIIFINTREIYDNFDVELGPQPIALEALLCLKILLLAEAISSRKFLIITYFFNGLRRNHSSHLTPHQFNKIQTNLRNLCKDLHFKFKEDHYKTFLNAFIHIWNSSEFTFYGEAVTIMNSLKERYYRNLTDILNKMIMCKSAHKNLFKLSLAIICNPPKYAVLEKIKITNEILVKNFILNSLSPKNEICSAAIEALSEILMSPDLDRNYIKEPIKELFNQPRNNIFNVPTILKVLQNLSNTKWGNRVRNKNLFAITVSIILFSEEEYPEKYREILQILSEEASPYDLKPFLPLLSETYITLNHKKFNYTALLVLKIIFKMALHPMASSTEFVKYLYTAMVYPNVCKGIQIKSETFIDPIISDDFNFNEFFHKCHTLGLIRGEHVNKMMSISTINESHLKFLCAIVHLTDYKELSVIADHINDNFTIICNSPNLNYLFYIYNNILKNNHSAMRLQQNLRCNEIMVCFIKHHLFRQTFRWNCIANAFSLLKSLEEFTDLNEDFSQFQEEYNRKLKSTLQNKSSFLPLLYSSQLVIFGKLLPTEENLTIMNIFLELCSSEIHRRSPDFSPKLWIGCLLLYTNISIIKVNLVENVLERLNNGLHSSVAAVKFASLNMTFDLCNLVTHNFEDLTKFMFNELIYGDDVFKKTCLLKIDRLIRDDYLKLDLEQFLVFITILGYRNLSLSDYCNHLLAENFFISGTSVIAKYFVPLIVHISGYRQHSLYKLSNTVLQTVEIISKNILNRRKIYRSLINSLPIKTRFNIIYVLSNHILSHIIDGKMKIDEGFWKMVTDSIFIFKLISTSNRNDDDDSENYYKKVSGQISKYILNSSEYNENIQYSEFHKEIIRGTEILLKLQFFNDSENIQKHIRICTFDALMHWTNFLLPDIIHIVHVERHKELQHNYTKLDQFYKKFANSLIYTEESFENDCNLVTSLNSNIVFNLNEDYVPSFDN